MVFLDRIAGCARLDLRSSHMTSLGLECIYKGGLNVQEVMDEREGIG